MFTAYKVATVPTRALFQLDWDGQGVKKKNKKQNYGALFWFCAIIIIDTKLLCDTQGQYVMLRGAAEPDELVLLLQYH